MAWAMVTGCAGNDSRVENSPIERNRLSEIYAGLLTQAELHRADSVRYARARDSVFRSAGIDSGQFRAAMTWYVERPQELSGLYGDVVRRLERDARVTRGEDSVRSSNGAAPQPPRSSSAPALPSLRKP
jgi:hypothetical protein